MLPGVDMAPQSGHPGSLHQAGGGLGGLPDLIQSRATRLSSTTEQTGAGLTPHITTTHYTTHTRTRTQTSQITNPNGQPSPPTMELKLGAADSNPAAFWDTGDGRSPQHKQTNPASAHSDSVWKRHHVRTHQHTQRLRCWLRGSTTVWSPQRISMTTVWIELSRFVWLLLTDVTDKLNSLNCELQGKQKTIADVMISAVKAFKSKLDYWVQRLQKKTKCSIFWMYKKR
ncbi:UNVERIFIED_CONTAM: hypothetical protein FKN15_068307 [Acipenser sinensis]